jgi:parallel beta-helix repeat protein
MAAGTASSHWRTRPACFVHEVRAMHWIRAHHLAVPLAILALVAGWGAAAASSPTPSSTIAVATSAPTPSPVPLIHVVVRGDTMWGIAQRYDVPLRTLIEVNPQITTPRLIHPGDRIWIPHEAMHVSSVGRPTRGTLVLTKSTILTADHRGNIVIRTDGVTLDCAGHVVRGPGIDQGPYWGGILIEGSSNVTVKRCIVSGFVRNGLFAGGSNIRLEENTFVGNGNHGVHLRSVSTGLVTGCTSRLNGTVQPAIGIAATKSANLTISGNIVSGNPWAGIALLDGTLSSTVESNAASSNGTAFIVESSGANSLLANTAVRNHDGFAILSSTGTVVSGNTATRNAHCGFCLDRGTSGAILTGNTANGDYDGFGIHASNANALNGNIANANRHYGFLVFGGASDNTLSYNTALRNGSYDAWEEGTGSGNAWSENTFQTTSGV